jgi:hypothetical protein
MRCIVDAKHFSRWRDESSEPRPSGHYRNDHEERPEAELEAAVAARLVAHATILADWKQLDWPRGGRIPTGGVRLMVK